MAMSKKNRVLEDMKSERNAAINGYAEAMRLANSLSKELRLCLEALEEERERAIREAEDRLIR
jgi:hypothetical protein